MLFRVFDWFIIPKTNLNGKETSQPTIRHTSMHVDMESILSQSEKATAFVRASQSPFCYSFSWRRGVSAALGWVMASADTGRCWQITWSHVRLVSIAHVAFEVLFACCFIKEQLSLRTSLIRWASCRRKILLLPLQSARFIPPEVSMTAYCTAAYVQSWLVSLSFSCFVVEYMLLLLLLLLLNMCKPY